MTLHEIKKRYSKSTIILLSNLYKKKNRANLNLIMQIKIFTLELEKINVYH